MFRGSDAEQSLLAFVAAVAALAGAEGAVQRGLDRLAEGLGVPLSLAIGPEVWTAGQGLPGADGPALTVAGARLDGVPAAASAGCARAADLFLRAAQEARAREQVAQARAAASGEVLFEVTGEGADGPWRSPAAAALWADRPQVRQALAPAIRQALGAPDGAEVRAVVSKAGPAQVFGVAAFPAGRPGLWLIRLIDRSEAEAAAARIDRRDLLLRGPGELLGARQSGLPLLRYADLERDAELVETARGWAERMLRDGSPLARAVIDRWMAGRQAFAQA